MFGVASKKQAAYLREAYGIARRNPRIEMLLWFLARDEARIRGWQSGFVSAGGRRKPSSGRVPDAGCGGAKAAGDAGARGAAGQARTGRSAPRCGWGQGGVRDWFSFGPMAAGP